MAQIDEGRAVRLCVRKGMSRGARRGHYLFSNKKIKGTERTGVNSLVPHTPDERTTPPSNHPEQSTHL
jgi:hypothetical protein